MVWLSHVGVGVCVDLVSLPAVRTMLLILSAIWSAFFFLSCREIGRQTDVDDVTTATGIKMQWGVTCWTVLPLEFTDELIKAGFMGDVRARELENSLSLQGMLERLLADGTLAAYKSALAAQAAPFCCASHNVVVNASNSPRKCTRG